MPPYDLVVLVIVVVSFQVLLAFILGVPIFQPFKPIHIKLVLHKI